MEHTKEPISIRITRLKAQILENSLTLDKNPSDFITKESLLDSIILLYDECNTDYLKKYDTNIAQFVDKYRIAINQLKKLRVNITDFEIKKVIGRGHFGEVHLVKQVHTGDVYALKRINKSVCSEQKNTFEQERDIMATCKSPWITLLYYAFQDSANLYFVMEYHPGGDLLGLLLRQNGTVPESAASFYVAELTMALNHLHGMGYVHRDIKLENVLLDRCGHLKVVDFGSAARINSNGFVNQGLPIGTPDYVAPEVLQSMESKTNRFAYGVSCDFWSLGVVAYELVVGSTPFSAPNASATYNKIMNYNKNVKFPPEIALTQAYTSLIKGLLTDCNSRLNYQQIVEHPLYENVNFNNLRDQVPPFVPKISDMEDTRNFVDVRDKKNTLDIDAFKTKTQFCGKNLPFIGFTFSREMPEIESNPNVIIKDERTDNLMKQVDSLEKKMAENADAKEELTQLQSKYEEAVRKIKIAEDIRNKLEKDLASSINASQAAKRNLEMERNDRAQLERKALEMIKSAKHKWELSEKSKLDALNKELSSCKTKNEQLSASNEVLAKQLEHVTSSETSHKSALDNVQKYSRQSIIGLENRLEKVTIDNHNQIGTLKNEIVRLTRETQQLEEKLISGAGDREILHGQFKTTLSECQELKNQLKDSKATVNDLQKKLQIAQTLKDVLKEKEKEMGDLRKQNSLLKDNDTIKQLKEELKREKSNCKILKQEIVELKGKLETATNTHESTVKKEKENREQQVHELQLQLKTIVADKADLEIKLHESVANDHNNKVKVQKLENLLSRLENGVSKLESDCDKDKGFNEQIKRLENQLIQVHETSAVDKKELTQLKSKSWMTERDLKNAEIDKRILKRELKEAEDENKRLESEIDGLRAQMEDNKKKYEQALMELNNLNENLAAEVAKFQLIRKNLEEKVEAEKEKCDLEKSISKELQRELEDKKAQINELKTAIEKMKTESAQVSRKFDATIQENNGFKKRFEEREKELVSISAELESCKRKLHDKKLNLDALREACILLENQVVEYEKIQASSEKQISSLNVINEKLIQDLSKSKQDVVDARKSVNEEKSLKLLAESKCQRLAEDVQHVENERDSYKKQCSEYKSHSNGLIEELTAAEEKITDLEVTAKSYERQISGLIDENHVLKEENSTQITHIRDIKETNRQINKNLTESKGDNTVLVQRLQETQKILNEKTQFYNEREVKYNATIQQQTKLIDFLQQKVEEGKKKKTLTDKLFGHAKKENQPPNANSELKSLLSKQNDINRSLRDEITRLNAELKYAKRSTTKPTPEEAPQTERKLVVEKFPKASAPEKKKIEKVDTGDIILEGWVKFPTKNNTAWERYYACLTAKCIHIYSHPPSTGRDLCPVESLQLISPESSAKVMVEPSKNEVAAPVTSADLPFVLKIEVNTACWPAKSLTIMALSVEDKYRWFKALEQLLRDYQPKYEGDVVVKWEPELDVNCHCVLDQTSQVIGTEQGLYSIVDNTLIHIAGPISVQQVLLLPVVDLVLMIADTNRILISCNSKHLAGLSKYAQCTRPALKFGVVNTSHLDGFHLLQASDFKKHSFVCAATSKQILLIFYDPRRSELVPLRALDTAEPTGCLLFTSHSLIVGADKFFEIDLATFEAEEFLDTSDPQLIQAAQCHRIKSFPIGVFCLSKKPVEFLCCFNEFAVFVDEFGRSTRPNELKWTRIPKAMCYIAPYLYIVQFKGVEMIRISTETCATPESDAQESCAESHRIDLEHAQYLGGYPKGVYVASKREIKFISAQNFEQDSASTTSTEETSEEADNSSEEFSFTSSLMHSLEGNLSDDTDNSQQKRVKFSPNTQF